MMTMRLAAFVALLLAVPFGTAIVHAEGMEAPRGWWTLREGETTTCLEIKPDHQLRLTFQGKMDRNPIVVDGEYRVTANKMADHHVTFAVTKIWQKQLSNCRKAWIDEDLHETRQLGRTIKAGDQLKLTLHFGCVDAHPTVQLCAHGAKTDVVCKQLSDPNGSCKESTGPAIDGAKINAPEVAPKKN